MLSGGIVQRLNNIFQMDVNVLIRLRMGDTWKYMYFHIFFGGGGMFVTQKFKFSKNFSAVINDLKFNKVTSKGFLANWISLGHFSYKKCIGSLIC